MTQLELHRSPPKGSPLDQYASKVTSQCGEDGIIARLIELIDPPKYCVEFGAWDGLLYSNCRDLVVSRGWSGLMIESDTARHAELCANYSGFPVTALNRLVSFEGPDRLDTILREADAPREIGVLSIDVDGADFHIWQSLERCTADIVVIEINPTVPNDVLFVQDRSMDVHSGSSLLAMIHLGKEKGYELVSATPCNAIFVRADKFHLTGVTDNRIGTLYHPLRDGRIFQGYDGTIHVVGMPDLFWFGIKLDQEDFQILPKSARTYPMHMMADPAVTQ